MKIMCWNVRGMGTPKTFRNVCDVLRHLSPPVVFLCETKCNDLSMNKLKFRLHYSGCFSVKSRGASGGLCLLWKSDVVVSIRSFSFYHIDALIQWNGMALRFTGLYGQPEGHLRTCTWELLRRLHNVDDSAWVVGGDLNEILWDSEKKGGPSRATGLMDNFRVALSDCNLRDLGFRGDIFTWCNRRPGLTRVFERLDRFLGNDAFHDLFPHFQVLNLDWQCSDHRPTSLCLDVNVLGRRSQQGSRGFKFNANWTQRSECRQFVHVALSGRGKSLPQCLDRCAQVLHRWGRRVDISLFQQIRSQRAAIQHAYSSMDPIDFSIIHAMENDLSKLLEEEEIYWHQRSKENWLKWGDSNTRWFHAKASARRKRNAIFGIQNEIGNWVTSDEDVEAVFVGYFQHIFTSTYPSEDSMHTILQGINPVITDSMNARLLAPFCRAEIEGALNQKFPTKAPGPDGFPALFFQTYWDLIGDKTVECCLEILNGQKSVREWNATNLVLIPKVSSPVVVADYRPISLCNVTYKLVAKVLVNRMKFILQEVVSENQSAFIPGRAIKLSPMNAYITYIGKGRARPA